MNYFKIVAIATVVILSACQHVSNTPNQQVEHYSVGNNWPPTYSADNVSSSTADQAQKKSYSK